MLIMYVQSIVFLQIILKRIMAEVPAEGPGFVGIRFCQECNNMLYPKEDKVVNDISAAVLIMIAKLIRTTGCCCTPVGTVITASLPIPAVFMSTRSCTRSKALSI